MPSSYYIFSLRVEKPPSNRDIKSRGAGVRRCCSRPPRSVTLPFGTDRGLPSGSKSRSQIHNHIQPCRQQLGGTHDAFPVSC